MMHSKIHNFKQHSGFTLIELMLSLTIGMFLLLGVTSIFNGTKRSSTLQNNLSAMSETARFSIETLTWHTRMAGSRDINLVLGKVSNALLVQNNPLAPDGFTVRYAAAVDCNQAPGVAGFVTIKFEIIDNALVCNDQVLFDDVVDMQIFIGEDTDNDSIVNRYRVQDGSVSSNRIKTLNINLLIRSDNTNLSDNAPNFINNFWSVAPGNDGRIYKEYSLNVTFRNLL